MTRSARFFSGGAPKSLDRRATYCAGTACGIRNESGSIFASEREISPVGELAGGDRDLAGVLDILDADPLLAAPSGPPRAASATPSGELFPPVSMLTGGSKF